MRYWVVDSETTGVGEEDKVVEIAGLYCEDGVVVDHYRSFVDPGISIPPTASAIHHITDKDVDGAPSIEDAMAPFFDKEFEYVVAHNSGFDRRFMDFGNCPWLCTWKLSMRLFPDAPSHSNQVLRYFFGLEDPVLAKQEFAHRALYDSEITTNLFHYILQNATKEDPWPGMQQVSENPILLKKVNFGKHYGMLWSEVPSNYLNFIINKSSGWDENVLHTAKYYYNR